MDGNWLAGMTNFLSYAQVRMLRAESQFAKPDCRARWTSVLPADRMRPSRQRKAITPYQGSGVRGHQSRLPDSSNSVLCSLFSVLCSLFSVLCHLLPSTARWAAKISRMPASARSINPFSWAREKLPFSAVAWVSIRPPSSVITTFMSTSAWESSS